MGIVINIPAARVLPVSDDVDGTLKPSRVEWLLPSEITPRVISMQRRMSAMGFRT